MNAPAPTDATSDLVDEITRMNLRALDRTLDVLYGRHLTEIKIEIMATIGNRLVCQIDEIRQTLTPPGIESRKPC